MRFLTERDVVSALDMRAAMAALDPVLMDNAAGRAFNLPKALATFGDGASMHALGAVADGFAGFKTWVHTKAGGGSIFSLFDANCGALLAMIEARALGQLRTAAITGVATKALAPPASRTAALIGTGPQAITQLAALAAAMPGIDEVRVYSPTPQRRADFVGKLSGRHRLRLTESDTLEAALHGAEIVTLITRASEPFVSAEHLVTCRHLNAVGAILPAKAEFAQDVFDRASRIVVDDIANAGRGSRELRERFGDDVSKWNSVTTLGSILADSDRQADGGDLSIFKPMGMGLSDLALAIEVYRAAERDGFGRDLPDQSRENLLESL